MNAVGIDVSKGKSMVAIMRPFGEIVSTPFEIKHTSSDINSLIEIINSVEGESRIVMEHTGRYYEALAHELSATTVASLKVADKPITFEYVISGEDGYDKDVALENAKYQALQQFGGDVLVKVSYQIKGNTITLSGYPATYSDFRTPTAEDRENLKAFGLAASLAEEK